MENTCDCPDPALCQKLNKHMKGRLWDIWNGINIDPKTAQKYRELWSKQAKVETPKVETQKMAVQSDGEKKSGCKCGKK